MVIEGDLDQLAQLMVDEQNTRLLAEASQIVENLDTQLCEMNSDEAITQYVSVLNDMGLS
jgi:vacuolar-type H+-ATPase subunit H